MTGIGFGHYVLDAVRLNPPVLLTRNAALILEGANDRK